jgi:hypothetical protein
MHSDCVLPSTHWSALYALEYSELIAAPHVPTVGCCASGSGGVAGLGGATAGTSVGSKQKEDPLQPLAHVVGGVVYGVTRSESLHVSDGGSGERSARLEQSCGGMGGGGEGGNGEGSGGDGAGTTGGGGGNGGSSQIGRVTLE